MTIKHKDDLAVEKFSAVMTAKLAKGREEKGRGGWDNKAETSALTLSTRLREHVEKGDPVDVANFAMMLHQRGESIVGRHPLKVELDSVSARLNMVTYGADRQIRTATAQVNVLSKALNEIVQVVQQSRSETRRLNWIEARAQSALEGKPWAKSVFAMPDPKNGLPKTERLGVENRNLKVEREECHVYLSRVLDDASIGADLFKEITDYLGSKGK